MPLTLFCVLADQQRAAARDVPAGSDSDDGRQMMKLLSVQRQRAMHGGAMLPPEFLSPPLFRSLRWRLSWWWWRMANGPNGWPMRRCDDAIDGQKQAKIGNPETYLCHVFVDVPWAMWRRGENVATHFRTRSVANTGDPVHWTYSLILRS